MNNDELIGHLLKIEKEAAALVNDAQAEADRRIAESEKHNRDEFDKIYHLHAEKLENEYVKNKEKLKEEYKKEIEAYRNELYAIDINIDGFSAIINNLLTGED